MIRNPPLTRSFREITARYNELGKSAKLFVLSLADWMLKGRSGTVTDKMERHLGGERVASRYFNADTGEIRRVRKGQAIPPRHMPILGTLGEAAHADS